MVRPRPLPVSPPEARIARIVRALLAVVVVAVAVLTSLASPPPVGAHAVVSSSSPADGARLPAAPTEVVITFSEPITSDLGGLTVLNQRGEKVDNGDSQQPDGVTLRATLRSGLGDGTYVANYKVVSADGHPINGALVFGVGSGQLADVSGVAQTTDPTLEAIGVVARFLTYLGALVAVGVAFFLAFLFDGAGDWGPLGRIVRVASAVAALGALLTVGVQAGLATGRGLSAAFDLSVLGPVLREGLGAQTVSLLIGLALCQGALSTRSRIAAQALVFYGGIAATAAFVWWGHATQSERSWLAVPADAVHTTVAAVWAGGLIGLAVLLRQRSTAPPVAAAMAVTTPVTTPVETPVGMAVGGPSSPVPDHGDGEDPADDDGSPAAEDADHGLPDRPGSFAATIHVVERFSTAAAISVVALAVTGMALGASELGGPSALLESTYGKALLVKLGVVAAILFIAGFNRFRLLPWLTGSGDDEETDGSEPASEVDDAGEPTDASGHGDPLDDGDDGDVRADEIPTPTGHWRPLIRTLLLEALGIVAVLGVTAVLVNLTPAANVVEPSPPFQESQPFRDGKVLLTITPNRPGTNDLHLEYIGADGRPYDPVRKVEIELRLPAKGVGPITRELPKAGTGHFLLENINDLSIPGTWELTLISRVSDFEQERNTFTDTIR